MRRNERGSAERRTSRSSSHSLGDSAYSYANNVRNGRVLNEPPFPDNPAISARHPLLFLLRHRSIYLFSASSTRYSSSRSLSLFSHSRKFPREIENEINQDREYPRYIRSCAIASSRRNFHEGKRRGTDERAVRQLFRKGGTLQAKPVSSEHLDVLIFKVAFRKRRNPERSTIPLLRVFARPRRIGDWDRRVVFRWVQFSISLISFHFFPIASKRRNYSRTSPAVEI